MKKIVLSSLMIVGLVGVVTMATRAAFSDTETSNNNTFASGSLDLDVNGNNGTNTVKFTLSGLRPGNQPTGTYRLNNVGTLNGSLNLEKISVVNHENGCVEPEKEAGDTTCDNEGEGQGELQKVLNWRLFWDADCDGSIDTGDDMVFNGKVGDVAAQYATNKSLNAGATQCLSSTFDWWNTTDDNKAMGDDFTLNLGFKLSQ